MPACLRYFMLLNTKAGEGEETADFGLPAIANIRASNNPEDGQPGKERAAEETAAIGSHDRANAGNKDSSRHSFSNW